MSSTVNVIAIDGPAGCGKSTIAEYMVSSHGFKKIDTGALFRSLGLYLNNHFEDLHNDILKVDIDQFYDFLKSLSFSYRPEPFEITLDGNKYSSELREHYVSDLASKVSTHPSVRKVIEDWQRKIVETSKQYYFVIEGRDIGTVVFPNAKLKLFLTALAEIRGERRFKQLKNNGTLGPLKLETIINDIKERDQRDSTRALAPLAKAKDAIEIDTSNLTEQSVLDKIKEILLEKGIINA